MFDFLTPAVSHYIAVFSIVFAVVMLILVLWGRRESRRMEAQELLTKIASWEITPANRLLSAYVIGNYIGKDSIGRVLREVIADLKGDGLPNTLKRLGWKIVKGAFLTNAEDRGTLRKLLDAAEALPNATVEAPPEV